MKKRTKEIDELLPQLLMLKRLMHTRFVRASGKFDPYGWVRMETMRFIGIEKTPNMQDIARHLSITAASATSLVSTLKKAGLVLRKPGKEDGRIVRIELTAAGKQELRKTTIRGEKVITDIFSELSNEDVRTLAKILARLGSAHTI